MPMRWLVDCCYLLVAVVLLPLMAYRAWTTGKYRQGWRQRRGYMPFLPPGQRRVWVHAVSVGEVNAVRGLVAAWRKCDPELDFVISTTTDTGFERASKLFADLTVIRYPLDLSWFVRRALDRIAPTMIVLVELEVWYQFVTLAAQRGIPVVVVNGRLSERSVRRFGRAAPLIRPMFKAIDGACVQDETYAERFRAMGISADRVHVTSSLKWDTAEVADTIGGADAMGAALGIDRRRPLWVCGSTGPGEEGVILDAYTRLLDNHPLLQLAIVPRKPERFEEVAEQIQRAGFQCLRRSQNPDGDHHEPISRAVFLGDTMGELRKLYSLADVVFVGRSLVNMGGSDVMEVAALAKPVVVGPHNENFADVVQQFEAASAVRVVAAEVDDPTAAAQLAVVVDELLSSPAAARQIAQAGREVVLRNRGSTERTLAILRRFACASNVCTIEQSG